MFAKQKFSKNSKFKIDIYFFVVALLLTISFSFLFLDGSTTSKTSISIILVPKNEKIAAQAEQVTKNLVELSKKPSFKEKVLDKTFDEALREKWNKIFDIKKINDSTLIEIGVSHKDEAISKKIANKSTQSLLSTASQYYNIKSDLGLKITSTPTTETTIKNWQWLLFSALALGLSIAFVVQFISIWFESFLSRKFSTRQSRLFRMPALPTLKSEEKTKTPEEAQKKINRLILEEEEGSPDAPVLFEELKTVSDSGSNIKKHQAPINLPTAPTQSNDPINDSEIPPNLPIAPAADGFANKSGLIINPISKDIDGNFTQEETVDRDNYVAEPSEEEYRKRLNQLLSGKIK